MNAREANTLLREKLPEGICFTVNEWFGRTHDQKPFHSSICVWAPDSQGRTFDLPDSQPVTDFSAAARAALDWARNQELGKGEAVAAPAPVEVKAAVPGKVRHEWRRLVSGILHLFENGECVAYAFEYDALGTGFFWRANPMTIGGNASSFDAAKAACIAKRLEILEGK